MEESFLTEFVRKDLEKIGFVTYAEVCVKGGGDKRCDMYARVEDPLADNFGETIAFEAKLSFNLKVLEQSYFWTKRANKCFIITLASNKNLSSRKFARELCRVLGIGVMEVDIQKEQYNITVKSATCENPIVPKLYKEQQMIKASNSSNTYMTPYKVTTINIYEYFRDKHFCYLSELIKNIKHHYKSEIAASRSIKYIIENKIIKGFYIIKKNHKIVIGKTDLYLTELDKLDKLKTHREDGFQDTN